MAIKIRKTEIRSLQLGSDSSRSATGYVRDYDISFETSSTAASLVDLIKGIIIRINFASLEIPDAECKWLYTTPENISGPIPQDLKAELIAWYKEYLKFELLLEKPVADDRGDYYFRLSDEHQLRVNFDKNSNEDDPLMVWMHIDIRELPGFEKSKDDAWQSYERDTDDLYIGMRPRWDEKHTTESVYDEATETWTEKVTNDLGLFLSGYSLDISFKCQIEGRLES